MSPVPPLSPDRLCHACDADRFSFKTTAELEDLTEAVGQMRAADAAQFGIGMRHAGYNLYVMGPAGVGKRFLVHQLLDKRVALDAKPYDWCYVHNFSQPHKPRAIQLPAGMGARLHGGALVGGAAHPLTASARVRAILPGRRSSRTGGDDGRRRESPERVLQSVAKGSPVAIYLASGKKLVGRIKAVDKFTVLLESHHGEQVIFKHAIATIGAVRHGADDEAAVERSHAEDAAPR